MIAVAFRRGVQNILLLIHDQWKKMREKESVTVNVQNICRNPGNKIQVTYKEKNNLIYAS